MTAQTRHYVITDAQPRPVLVDGRPARPLRAGRFIGWVLLALTVVSLAGALLSTLNV